ncbi:MAG TPA: amidohydrolase family protein [Vicinamibacteria bacterium]|nr:amidohydrolase family protein [Vicinamibacteria bacterium]
MKRAPRRVLRDARLWSAGTLSAGHVVTEGGRVVAAGGVAGESEPGVDLAGRVVLPGLVNAHDHLDFSTFPPLGRPPYPSAYAWAADVDSGRDDRAVAAALAVPLPDRLFLGGLRNLLAGATAVAHHGPYHRALARPDFPVRVLARYHFAHSPGLTPALRRTYRTTDRRIPWLVHAGEGTDDRCRGELRALEQANVLRQNTVIIHAIALGDGDAQRIAAAKACVVWCPEANRHLYRATADVAALRAAGVRIGLGSDSPVSGARDPLSNLAAARAERIVSDDGLVEMATSGSAEVARLAAGGTEAGRPADLVAIDSMEAWLAGDRRALALVMVGGRPLYGAPPLLDALGVRWRPVSVDGAARGLDAELARRATGLVRGHPALAAVRWLSGLVFDREDDPSGSPLPEGPPP